MGFSECMAKVLKTEQLSAEEQTVLEGLTRKVMAKLTNDGTLHRDTAVVRETKRRGKELTADALYRQRNALLSQAQFLNEKNKMGMEDWKDDPVGFFRALGEGIKSPRYGAANSLLGASDTERFGRQAAFVGELRQAGLFQTLRDTRTLDKDLRLYIKAAEKGQDVSKFSPTVVEAGDIIRSHLRALYHDWAMAGGKAVHEVGDFLDASHDSWRIRYAAGMWKSTDEHMAAWRAFTEPLLDWAAMADVTDRTAYFNRVWADLGEQGRTQETPMKFKDGEGAHAYFEKFGESRDGLMGGIMFSLNRYGRDIGLWNRLGPNPVGTFKKLGEAARERLRNAGDAGKLDDLNKTLDRQLNQVLPVITGDVEAPKSLALAAFYDVTANVLRLAELGSMVPGSFADIGTRTANENFYGQRSLTNHIAKLVKNTAEYPKVFAGLGESDRALMANAGIMMEDFLLPTSHGNDFHPLSGALGKFTRFGLFMFGAQAHSNHIRFNAFKAAAGRYGAYAGQAYKDLPEGPRAQLLRAEITPEEWDIVSAIKPADYRGYDILHGGLIAALPDSAFPGPNPAKARKALAGKFTNMLREESNAAATVAEGSDLATMTLGTNKGTLLGVATRLVLLFKTFPVAFIRKHIDRELHGYHKERLPFHKAVLRAVSHGPARAGLTRLIATNLAYGLAATYLVDMAKGKKPTVPETPEQFTKLMGNAVMRSGVFGLYGDVFATQVNAHTSGTEFMANLFLGPAFRKASNVADVGLAMWSGNMDKASQNAFRTFYQTIPGIKTFYARYAFDLLIYYRFKELIDPGSLSNLEMRMREDGEEFMIPPTSVVPLGGF